MDYENLSDADDDFFDSIPTLDEDVEPVSPDEELAEDLVEAISPEPLEEFEDVGTTNEPDINVSTKQEEKPEAQEEIVSKICSGPENGNSKIAAGLEVDSKRTDVGSGVVVIRQPDSTHNQDPGTDYHEQEQLGDQSDAKKTKDNLCDGVVSDGHVATVDDEINIRTTPVTESGSPQYATVSPAEKPASNLPGQGMVRESVASVTDNSFSENVKVEVLEDTSRMLVASHLETTSPVSTEGISEEENEVEKISTEQGGNNTQSLNENVVSSNDIEKDSIEPIPVSPSSTEILDEELSEAIEALIETCAANNTAGKDEESEQSSREPIETETTVQVMLPHSPHSDISDTSLGMPELAEGSDRNFELSTDGHVASSVAEDICTETVKAMENDDAVDELSGKIGKIMEDSGLTSISPVPESVLSEEITVKEAVSLIPADIKLTGTESLESEELIAEQTSSSEGGAMQLFVCSDTVEPVEENKESVPVNQQGDAFSQSEVREEKCDEKCNQVMEVTETVSSPEKNKDNAQVNEIPATTNPGTAEGVQLGNVSAIKKGELEEKPVDHSSAAGDDAGDHFEDLSDVGEDEEFLLVDELCIEKEDEEIEQVEGEDQVERSFSSLGLDVEPALCLELAGYSKPSRFQLSFLPPCLSGKDVVVVTDKKTMAETSAVLAAYLLQVVDVSDRRTQCIVMGWSDFVLDVAQKEFRKLTESRLSSAAVARTAFKGLNAQVIFGSIFNLWRLGMSNCDSIDGENVKTVIMYEPLVTLNGQMPTLHTAMDSVLEFICSDARKQQWIAISTVGLEVLKKLFHDNGRQPDVIVVEEKTVENRVRSPEKGETRNPTVKEKSATGEKFLDQDDLYEALSLSEDEDGEPESKTEKQGETSESGGMKSQVSDGEKPGESGTERLAESLEQASGKRRVVMKESDKCFPEMKDSKDSTRRSPCDLPRRADSDTHRSIESRQSRENSLSDTRKFASESEFLLTQSPVKSARREVRTERSPVRERFVDGRRVESSRLSPRRSRVSPRRDSYLCPDERRYESERGRFRWSNRRDSSPVRSRRDLSPRMRDETPRYRKRSCSPLGQTSRVSPVRSLRPKLSPSAVQKENNKSVVKNESDKGETIARGKIEVVTRARNDRRIVETTVRKVGDNLIPLSVQTADILPSLPERDRRFVVTEGKYSIPTLVAVSRVPEQSCVVEVKPAVKKNVVKIDDGPPGEEAGFKPKPVQSSSRDKDRSVDISRKRVAPPGEDVEIKRTREMSPRKEKESVVMPKPSLRTVKSQGSESSGPKAGKSSNVQVGPMPQTRQRLMQPILAKIEEDKKRPDKLLLSLGLDQHVSTCLTAYTKRCQFDPERFREFLVPCVEGQDVLAEVDSGMHTVSALCTVLTHMLDPSCMDYQALVLAPSPVLANHAHHQIAEFIKAINLTAHCSNDYLSYDAEVTDLTLGIRNQVAIGTPSRILRLLKRNLLGNRIRFVALYNLDELTIDSAKTVQLEECLRFISTERQVVATAAKLSETLVTFLRLQTRLPPLVVRLGKVSKLSVKGVPQLLTTIPTYCLNLPTWQSNLAKLILRFVSRRIVVICDHDFASLYSEALRAKGIKHSLALNRKEFLESVEAFSSFATSVVVTSVYVNTFGKMRPDLVVCEGVQDVTDYYHRLESFCYGQRVTYVNLAESSDLNTYKKIEEELEYQFQVVASVNDITTI